MRIYFRFNFKKDKRDMESFFMTLQLRKCLFIGFCVVCSFTVYYLTVIHGLQIPPVCKIYPGSANLSSGNYFESHQSPLSISHHYPTANSSKTRPPYYPFNGTGRTFDISLDSDTESFKDFCETERDLEAVVPVYSAPGNFERRKAMRETIGKICVNLKCKIFFIIGVSIETVIYLKVKEEIVDTHDILMINKVDTYRDLNNKVLAMLDFFIECCRTPKYIVHVIDDFYPNLKQIIGQLRKLDKNKFILGEILTNTRPLRNKGSKWYLSIEEYPYAQFPSYIVGVAYAFLNNDSTLLRQAVHAAEYCWIEDVWFTGHVREKAGFQTIAFTKPTATMNAKYSKKPFDEQSGIHFVNAHDFYLIYNKTMQ